MRILILGGTGMLGHTAWQIFEQDFDVYVTVRHSLDSFNKKVIDNAHVENSKDFTRIINAVEPDVILNCIGITKESKDITDSIKTIMVNSLFPHEIADICYTRNIRLIHLSTDCVFSGKKGNYTENDTPDSIDLYGKTKLLGEIDHGNTLTIRTSMIGRTLNTKYGLLEWFLAQENKTIKGYTNSIFSGFTTFELCRILKNIITNHTDCKGLYHISSEPISKFDLLTLIKNKMNLNINIIPDATLKCDRSLDSTRFRREFNYTPPSWKEMIK